VNQRLRASAICRAEGRLLVVRLRDPVTGIEAFFPPGGAIEPDETPAQSARRETLEETGLRVRIDPEVEIVETYPFRWAGVDYDVTTHSFAAALMDPFDPTPPRVVDAPYNLGASWLPVSDALEAMSVHRSISAGVARVLRLADRAEWQRHPHIAGPASTLLAIHDQFRVASKRVSLLVEREADMGFARVARSFAPLAQALHHHHHAEEAMLFPLVQQRTGIAPEQLVIDHQVLMAAIGAVEETLAAPGEAAKPSAKSATARFHEVLVAHLDREESLVIPVLLSMTPSEAWALIHGA
jgi:8-oxo-dGTP pyrophosphatase MutT (NUDIX family)